MAVCDMTRQQRHCRAHTKQASGSTAAEHCGADYSSTVAVLHGRIGCVNVNVRQAQRERRPVALDDEVERVRGAAELRVQVRNPLNSTVAAVLCCRRCHRKVRTGLNNAGRVQHTTGEYRRGGKTAAH